MATSQELTILHFNDVYHVSNTDLIARFATVLVEPDFILDKGNPSFSTTTDSTKHTLRIFSGDAFSPSLEAAVLRGEHMAPVLDGLDIDVACYGNHDFDFGETRLLELARQTQFPWLLANVVVTEHEGHGGRLLAGAREYVVREVGGYRIGFFGLAGMDWPSNCQHLPKGTAFLDASGVARRLASHLRLSEKCDFVIAITHMRLVDDLAVSNATLWGVEKVDLVLGGHDHHVVRRETGENDPDPDVNVFEDTENINSFSGNVRIVKSGSDWHGLSMLRLRLERDSQGNAVISNTALRQITDLEKLPNYNTIPPSRQMLKTLHTIHDRIQANVQQPLLHTDVPLEGRTRLVRRQETNLGNLIADSARAFYNCDVALVNSGGIRCDRVIECTTNRSSSNDIPLSIRDVIEICPFDNALVVKRVSGRVLREALENAVSNAFSDGRFLQLAGLRVSVDWTQDEGERVCSVLFTPAEGPAQSLDEDHVYTVTMAAFLGDGFDGYSCFREADTVVDVEQAVTDTNLLLEMFKLTGTIEAVDEYSKGICRARRAVIRRVHGDGLPVVAPVVEERIQVLTTSYDKI